MGLGLLGAMGWAIHHGSYPARWVAGTLHWPPPATMAFVAWWSLLGLGSAIAIAVGVSRWLERRPPPRASLLALEPLVVALATLLAFLIPFAVRMLVLEDAPVTDDEAAYRFSAEILASGQLTAPVPPEKLFFDRAFVTTDGRWYSQYFLGWPALMVPFVWLGVSGYANTFYSALTVPCLHRLLRRLVGARWAAVGLGLYVTSPMLMLAAATEMSHTSCLFALVLAGWQLLRCLDEPGDPKRHAALAGALCLAFFIRPLSGFAIGGVIALGWLWSAARRPDARRGVLAFTLVATVGAGTFLGINTAQNGGPFVTAYAEVRRFGLENDFRFTTRLRTTPTRTLANMNFAEPVKGASNLAAGTLRLWFALFAWPAGFALALVPSRRRWVPWARGAALAYFGCNFFLSDVGVDIFGPTHLFEAAAPLLLLTAAGLADLTRWVGRVEERRAGLPLALAGAMTLVGWVTYVPARVGPMRDHAVAVNQLYTAPAQAGLSDAVVFSYFHGVAYCAPPSHGWVFWRPSPHPDLSDDVLWVNHIDIAEDQRFMKTLYPDRKGYVAVWTTDCEVRLLPLEPMRPGDLPPAKQECCHPPPFIEIRYAP